MLQETRRLNHEITLEAQKQLHLYRVNENITTPEALSLILETLKDESVKQAIAYSRDGIVYEVVPNTTIVYPKEESEANGIWN